MLIGTSQESEWIMSVFSYVALDDYLFADLHSFRLVRTAFAISK